jgi:hypothetical protein
LRNRAVDDPFYSRIHVLQAKAPHELNEAELSNEFADEFIGK